MRSWQAGYRGIVAQAYLDALTPSRWADAFRAGAGTPDAPQGLVLCAEDGAVAGASHFSAARNTDVPAGYGEIISLYLLPEHWGKGWGLALLQAAVEALRGQGFSSALLWTLRDNVRAQRTYLPAGFHRDGAEKLVEVGGERLPAMRFVRYL